MPNGQIERALPMRVHKRLVIAHLKAHPEDGLSIIPVNWRSPAADWSGRVAEYIAALEVAPGEWFVGVLEAPE